MLRTRFFLRSISFLAGLAAVASADTVILKNGEKVEGRILEENATQVTVEVQVSASIKDERVIKKTDIDKISKVQPDVEAWAPLKGLALGEESFESSDYQAAINRLTGFVTMFPNSPLAKEAKEKAAQFEEEKKRVDMGELKEKGKWLTKEQVKDERVQISGRLILSRMKRLAAAGQLVDAMNFYDVLEKNFPGSYAMPEAIELAQQIVPSIKVAADQQKARVVAQAEENKRRLLAAPEGEQAQLNALLTKQKQANDTAAEAAEKSGVRWLPLSPSNERTLSSLSSKAASEIGALRNKPVDKMRQSIASAEAARAALEAKDLDAAEKAITEATSAWSNNDVAKRLRVKLTEARKAAAEAKAAAAEAESAAKMRAAAEAEKPKPTPAPVSAPVAAASAAPGGEDRVMKEDPFYTKPIFWVVMGLLGLFGFLGNKAYKKFSDPNKNLLDQ